MSAGSAAAPTGRRPGRWTVGAATVFTRSATGQLALFVTPVGGGVIAGDLSPAEARDVIAALTSALEER